MPISELAPLCFLARPRARQQLSAPVLSSSRTRRRVLLSSEFPPDCLFDRLCVRLADKFKLGVIYTNHFTFLPVIASAIVLIPVSAPIRRLIL